MANENVNIRLGATNTSGPAFRSFDLSLTKATRSIFNMQNAIATLAGATGFGLLVKSTVATNREFQSLEASLGTFLGGAENASKAFKVLEQFASTTPFSLREVVGGFNKLVARGINPSISALTAFGNIASGTGKTLDQFVEAAADAAVGEFERLKEFGIKARSEGENVVFTFKGVETEIKKSASSISAFLVQLGETEFGGAIERQSKTLNGAFSNLGDSFDSFKRAVGEAGFNESLVNLAKFFSNASKSGDGLAQTLGQFLSGATNMIPVAFLKLGEAVDFVRRNMDFLKKTFIVVAAGGFAKLIFNQAVAMLRFSSAILSATKAMALFRAGTKLLTISSTITIVLLAEMTGQLDNLVSAIKKATDASIEMIDKVFPGFKSGIENLLPSLEADIAAVEHLAKQTDVSVMTLKEMDATLAEIVPTFGEATQKTSEFSDSLKRLSEDSLNTDKQLADFAVSGVKGLEDALVGVVSQTTSVKDAFKAMANSIIQDLIRMQIQQAITGPIANALSGLTIGSGTPSASPSATPSAIPTVSVDGARAMGGPVAAGKSYLVGEDGPEIVKFKKDGMVSPNGADMGGVVVHQVVNLSVGVQDAVRREIGAILPALRQASVSGVMEAAQRGGRNSHLVRL